jgi:hypothetical protein
MTIAYRLTPMTAPIVVEPGAPVSGPDVVGTGNPEFEKEMRWEFFAASSAPWAVSWPASSGCCAAYYRASAACCGDSFEWL